jgi:hypothetical protein
LEGARLGYEITVFDNLSRVGAAANVALLASSASVSIVHGGIRSASDISRVVSAGFDAVFRLAAQVAMTTSIRDPRRDFETNAVGTFNLLDCLRTESSEAVPIYASTNKVYRIPDRSTRYEETATRYMAVDYPCGFPESLPFDHETPYGVSKGAADSLVRDAWRVFGLRTIVFRHSSIYAGRQLFGRLVAQGRYSDLDALLRRTVSIATAVTVLGSFAVLALVLGLRRMGSPYADRLLPVGPVVAFAVVGLTQTWNGAMATYFRAHKREPLMGISVVSAVTVTGAVIFFGTRYGAAQASYAYLVVMLLWHCPATYVIFRRSRIEWHRQVVGFRVGEGSGSLESDDQGVVCSLPMAERTL